MEILCWTLEPFGRAESVSAEVPKLENQKPLERKDSAAVFVLASLGTACDSARDARHCQENIDRPW